MSQVDSAPGNARLFARWVSACAAGEALGLSLSGVVAAVVGTLATPDFGEPDPWTLRGLMVLAGYIEGACFGAAQWQLLRRRFPRMNGGLFIMGTGAGMALGWAAGSLIAGGSEEFANPNMGTMLVYAVTSGVGLGAILGGVQALQLRHHTPGANRWIVANAVGWGIAMVVSYFGTNLMPAGAYGPGAIGVLLVTGGVMGAIVGIATWLLAPRQSVR